MAPSPPSSPSPPASPPAPPRPTLLTSLGDVLTADLDDSKFHFLHPRRIPLIQNPLDFDGNDESGGQALGVEEAGVEQLAPEEPREPQPEAAPAAAAVATKGGAEHHHHRLHFGPDPFELAPDEPPLRFQTESSTIQLFYDLFFVANLTTFTAKHDVKDGSTLKSYVGYFALLWFTWLQVALFDIRFGYDSAFERVCKAAQFGVMVGLAVEGTLYDFDQYSANAFRDISFILMGSRVVLMIQYGVTLFWLKGWKKAQFPLLVHVGTMFTTAMIFLGLAFGFTKNDNTARFVDGFYVTMAIEAAVILFVSGRTSFLNFRRTNIIERLGLLTLIILGEGIMGLGEQVNKINGADAVFSSDIIGLIVSSVLIIYFIYFLYFDQTETKGRRVGSFRQQLWTIGHFPLHVCILLVVAGLGQLTVWQKFNDAVNLVFNVLIDLLPDDGNPTDWQNYVNQVNATLQHNWPEVNFTSYLAVLGTPPFDPTSNATWDAIFGIMDFVTQDVAHRYQVDVPESAASSSGYVLGIYQTVYIYFFCGAGLVLVCLACIFMLGKKDKTRVEYASAGVRLAVGFGLALLTTMIIPWIYDSPASTSKTLDIFANYFSSPWLIPTVILAYALVVALDVVLIVLSRVLYTRRGSVGSIEKA